MTITTMINCFLCRQKKLQLKYVLPQKRIYECLNDRLCFGQNTGKASKLYGFNYYKNSPYPDRLYQRYFQKKIGLIKRLTGIKNLNVLDIGCGWGQFLDQLKKNRIGYKGIDMSEEAIKICQEKNLNCEQITVKKLAEKENNKYHVVTCFQTIEHIENPTGFLRSVKQLLKKNGIILLTTPNNDTPLRKLLGSRWSIYNTDSHFVFYNEKTIKKLLMNMGFSKIRVAIDDWRFMSSRYIFSRLNIPFFYKLNIPVPTDPLGDLIATGFKDE